MKTESVLIFIDGTICDDRHRVNLYGTADFYKEENVMKDKPVPGSVKFVNELAQRYKIMVLVNKCVGSICRTIYCGCQASDIYKYRGLTIT